MKALDKTLVSCLAHDVLHLIVLPTEARSGRMEPRVVRGIKNLLTDRADELSHLTLSWFGGEPLLAREVMEDVLRHVQILRAKHPTMRVRSDVTTGGQHLDRTALERLVALGADRFRVSIAGPEGAALQRVWDNLASLRGVKGDFQVQVGLHVERANQSALPALIDQFAETFGMDERFPLVVQRPPLHDPSKGSERAVLDDEGYRVLLQSLRARARARGVSRSAESPQRATRHDSHTNSFVVRADGRVDKCTVFLGHPGNRVGRLHESGRLELDGNGGAGPCAADFQ